MVYIERNTYENYDKECMCSATKMRKFKKRLSLCSKELSPNKLSGENINSSKESLIKSVISTSTYTPTSKKISSLYKKPKKHMSYSTYSINETGLRSGTLLNRGKASFDSSTIDFLNIPESDRRILELLALKKEQEIHSKNLAYESQILWEKSQNERIKADNEQKQRWQSYVRDKRKCDGIQHLFRMEDVKQNLKESHKTLEDRFRKRHAQMSEFKKECNLKKDIELKRKHELTLLKKAIIDSNHRLKEDEVEEFYQKHLEELEEKLNKAESTRHNKKELCYRRIASANRYENMRHQENMLELMWEQDQMKQQKEKHCKERESRARERQIHHQHVTEKRIKQSRAEAEHRAAHVRQMHLELNRGLEAWQDQVLLLQWADLQRAKAAVSNQLKTRKMRIAIENMQRRQQHQQRIQKVKEAEELKQQSVREAIQAKEHRIRLLQKQREIELFEGRAQAQMTAELRDHLRRTLSPETFDRKVARAALETRINNHAVTASPSLLSSHIQLG